MAQAISRQDITAEARVRAQVSPCEICGGKVAVRQIFSEFFGFTVSVFHHTAFAVASQ
jgi:hypothetical protein